ncbi:hypothetical protein Scep_019231 [Stephania cephalantha]|uniref:Uncharacterized protein n=1 Tax=Stephania cephalantha TaxID=152367 RepID=A0AAP0NL46_9MAGN
MTKHIVAVKGRIVPEKMLKKLKKKTGKKVEIVIRKDGTKPNDNNSKNPLNYVHS